MITVNTKYPIACDSKDHITPYGCIRDSNTNEFFINEIVNHFKKEKLKVLDIGCAGAQLIVDHHNRGDIAVGIEGSSNVLIGVGNHNWKQYKDNFLFLCDASRPYEILLDNKKIKFDFIQCWEVLEHIPTERLHLYLTNVKNHLVEDGLFCGSISTVDCSSGTHVSILPKERWVTIFNDAGLTMEEYTFNNKLRNENFAIFFKSKHLTN